MNEPLNLPGQARNPIRAEFDRNLTSAFMEGVDSSPTLLDEMFVHRIQIGEAFLRFIRESPVYARLERKTREMFVDANNTLLEANPTDTATIAEAQVQALAALKVMAIINEAVEEATLAKQESKLRNDAHVQIV